MTPMRIMCWAFVVCQMLGIIPLSVRTYVIAGARVFVVSQYSEQRITCVVK